MHENVSMYMDVCWCVWMYVDVYGCMLHVDVDVCWYMLMHVNVYWCIWLFVRVFWCIWMYVNACGYIDVWRCMMVYMGVCRCMWMYVDVCGGSGCLMFFFQFLFFSPTTHSQTLSLSANSLYLLFLTLPISLPTRPLLPQHTQHIYIFSNFRLECVFIFVEKRFMRMNIFTIPIITFLHLPQRVRKSTLKLYCNISTRVLHV